MENYLTFDIEEIIKSVLVFLRISGLFFALPFFGDSVVPMQSRILTAGALALGIFPLVPTNWNADITYSVLAIFACILREVFIGLVIGYIGKLIFEGIIMAAGIVGYQMGFGTANLLLPGSDIQLNAFTALHRIVVILFFLSLSLHYIFINGIIQTFQVIPAGGSILTPALGNTLLENSSNIFTIAVQLSAPILIALLFTMSSLGLIARTVPQLNVFTMSFPLSFFIGLSVYVTMTPFLPGWLNEFYKEKGIEFLNSILTLTH